MKTFNLEELLKGRQKFLAICEKKGGVASITNKAISVGILHLAFVYQMILAFW